MEDLVKKAITAGAYRAGRMEVKKIKFDAGLRAYCEANACGHYNRNHMCPPAIGTKEETIRQAQQYRFALIFQTVSELEDSFDVEGMQEALKKHDEVALRIERAVREQGKPYLQLTAGGCHVCPYCAKTEDKPCRFPKKAISSLEAYCINVATLAADCGMNYINGQNTVTYFGGFFF